MNRNHLHQDFCHHHPNLAIIGVCHFCLNDKLLSLAANHTPEEQLASRTFHGRKLNNLDRTKIFALGTLINRRTASDQDSGSTDSEGSFISIQFEAEESNACEQEQVVVVAKSSEPEDLRKSVMVQHRSTMSRGSMRWRKRIGQLLKLVRWRRSSKVKGATSSHGNGVAGFGKVKKNRGWIGAFTKRRSSN